MGGLGGQLKKTTNRSVINVNSHLEARLSSCHNFYLRKLSSREKNHCQTEGTSSKPWPMCHATLGGCEAAGSSSVPFGTAKRVPFGPAAVSAGLNGSHLR